MDNIDNQLIPMEQRTSEISRLVSQHDDKSMAQRRIQNQVQPTVPIKKSAIIHPLQCVISNTFPLPVIDFLNHVCHHKSVTTKFLTMLAWYRSTLSRIQPGTDAYVYIYTFLLSIATALKLFTIKVAPIVTYGIQLIWNYLTYTNLKRLEGVKTAYQKRCYASQNTHLTE